MWGWIPAGTPSTTSLSAIGSLLRNWSYSELAVSPVYEPLAMLATGAVLIVAASFWRRRISGKIESLRENTP